MPRYDVSLEIGPAGACLAHVLALPGCIVRADRRADALAALPDAIRAHHAWLRRHGETIDELPEPITYQVADVSDGIGPFERGDPAALFAADQAPLRRDELKQHLRISSSARADLLDLVADLPEVTLDRHADPTAMSVRQILRHVGNAEQWYVSRLVAPDTLPPAWTDDEHLPILTFLAMERLTAVDRLRRLTDRELAEVVYPTQWTDHPDEPWTARKALRRMIEHELEHAGQIRALLGQEP